MCLFWEKGYTAASIQQLLDTMSLNRGSMYATFGDKRALYIKALDLYDRMIMDDIISLITGADDPIKGIRSFFKFYFLDLTEEQLRLGCFLINTIVELSDIDEELVNLASQKAKRPEMAIETALLKAREMGKLDKSKDPASIARYLMLLVKGLRVTVKETQDKQLLEENITTGLAILS